MTDKDDWSRIKTLFFCYKSILRRHGLSWVTNDDERVAVYQVLSANRPETLRDRLESDPSCRIMAYADSSKDPWPMPLHIQNYFGLLKIGLLQNRRGLLIPTLVENAAARATTTIPTMAETAKIEMVVTTLPPNAQHPPALGRLTSRNTYGNFYATVRRAPTTKRRP